MRSQPSIDFWLDDAFASGGSAGYDHKKMGITARGAWEAVKRHFREMDVDIGKTPFTVVGVGDMSGDVFGNGMLRERTIKLVAAFDHRDIFIDPVPDPDSSFAERQRLFDLPRSSWQDYDKTLISSGGGVYSALARRRSRSRRRAQAHWASTRTKATPQEVMNAILKAPVDLLFFGGIGTYVRASAEDRRSGRRPRQRRRSASPAAELRCQGDRRGRQSRHDAARPDRGGAARRPAQYRRHRQFGRRQHLRPRGQSQDRADDADARRPAHARCAQCAAGRDDRRGGGAGAAQQLSADACAFAGGAARARGHRLRAAADADAGIGRRARSRGRVPARRHGDRRAPAALAGADAAGAGGAAGLCQALAQPAIWSDRACRTIPISARELGRYFPARDLGEISGCARASPAAARDHRHPARQLDDQSRRPLAAGAHRRPDRRLGRRASRRRSPRCATATA